MSDIAPDSTGVSTSELIVTVSATVTHPEGTVVDEFGNLIQPKA